MYCFLGGCIVFFGGCIVFWVVVLPTRAIWTPGEGEDIAEINWQIGLLSWKATHHKWIDGLADPAHWSYQVRWMCLGVGVGV